ncbi:MULTISPECIES: hypothetical protein [Xenorhabdus]|uniref:hypothetical protein n=1 Tax=Xenorhabdus TaxID=626 RepID=UPI00064995BC|nr:MULTISPECIES: hypothetical protein [Xenorhabdus]KLU17016.1 hypothetical protein AAY47_02080 [Xenorhabdus griffiniae]KOP31849.1 hypothetical protein AFK69_18675 [Xenorhabdus sp. GDc328]
MQKNEPVIIANGNTIEEIYQWMEHKLDARRDVISLARQVEYLNKAREKVNQQLDNAINQAKINPYKQDHDREINNASDPIMKLERERHEIIRQLNYPEGDEHDYESLVRDCKACCHSPSFPSQE